MAHVQNKAGMRSGPPAPLRPKETGKAWAGRMPEQIEHPGWVLNPGFTVGSPCKAEQRSHLACSVKLRAEEDTLPGHAKRLIAGKQRRLQYIVTMMADVLPDPTAHFS